MKPIVLGQFQNGLAQLGKLDQNRWMTLDNCNIHSETGLVEPNLAMTSESTTPNEACFRAIVPSGKVYFLSKTSGKIWERTTGGSYSLVNTNANGAHRGAQYFNGYLFYWTATKLGHFNLASTWTDTFATFTNGNARGSTEHANSLIINDGKYAARVDSANVFSANEFVVPAQFNLTDCVSIGDDVLFGSYISTEVAYCKAFLWDSVSTSWTYEDEVYEIGINQFLKLDNIYLAQCGVSGAFYYWTGSRLAYFGKIRGITTALGEQMTDVYNRRLLFANATKIYSIHKEDNSLNFAFCGEYTCTGTIASIIVQGQQLLASVGTGVDKRGTSYATATIEGPEIEISPNDQPKEGVYVRYDTYGEGVGIQVSINGAAYVAKTEVIDALRKTVRYNGGDMYGATLQAKVTLTPSGANVPKIKSIIIK